MSMGCVTAVTDPVGRSPWWSFDHLMRQPTPCDSHHSLSSRHTILMQRTACNHFLQLKIGHTLSRVILLFLAGNRFRCWLGLEYGDSLVQG